MAQTISQQHPAVVLRSHYLHMRALLAIAMIAVVGLSVAIVVVAAGDDSVSRSQSAGPVAAPSTVAPGRRHDGGPEEGTRGTLDRGVSARATGSASTAGPKKAAGAPGTSATAAVGAARRAAPGTVRSV